MVVTDRRFRAEHRELRARVKKTVLWCLLVDAALYVVIQPFRPVLVVGESMRPTLDNMQLVIGRRPDHDPVRGEVYVCDWSDEQIVKRVAGIAGDTGLPGLPRPVTVPNGHVYLLGDNAKVSVDSRTFGPVPTKDLRLQVVFPEPSPN